MSESAKKFIFALATFSGTIIGVGFFSLPYITLKTGIFLILGYFLILGILVSLVHLFFGELALKTPDFKRFPAFAKIYLGEKGEKIALISTILGLFGANLAYLIVGGEFLENLFSPILGRDNLFWTLVYFSLGTILIFLGIKIISKIELLALLSFFLILILMFVKGFPYFKISNLFLSSPNFSNFFLPYGPILFSLWGAALIPEVEEMLGEDKKLIKKLISLGIFIPILVYLFFILLVLGITGVQTTESALPGLRSFFAPNIFSLALLLGVFTTFTSFIALGLTLKKVFWYDLKMEENLAWLITCFVPLTLFLAGARNFIPIISFLGAFMLGIDGILILLMYQKIKSRKFWFLTFPLILIFVFGIIYEIIYFLR